MAKTIFHKSGKINTSEVLRRAMSKITGKGWDLRTVTAAEITTKACSVLRDAARRNRGKAETDKLVQSFKPHPVHVSIVKREFCEKLDGPGRPSHESIGLVEEAA